MVVKFIEPIRITVTADDVNAAVLGLKTEDYCVSCCCPIFRALKRLGYNPITVGFLKVQFTGDYPGQIMFELDQNGRRLTQIWSDEWCKINTPVEVCLTLAPPTTLPTDRPHL